ncbi:MAG: tellurite resistance protein [Myxococcota bacterium]|jgi:tellurite resistance protein
MHLSNRIAESGLSDAVAQTFADGLKQVAIADGPENDVERQLITRLVDVLWTSSSDPAPFEALWPCAELFLTACVYVAVADGEYAVEEARRISLFAHRLGYSARRLSELESRVFEELHQRGELEKQRSAAIQRPRPPRQIGRGIPAPDSTTAWLRSSDAELMSSADEVTENAGPLDEDVTEPIIIPATGPAGPRD